MSAMSVKQLRLAVRFVAAAVLFSGVWATVPAASAQTGDEPIVLEMSSSSGVPGDSVEVGISLRTAGHSVGGIQIDIQADPPLAINRIGTGVNSKPDCWRNPEINKDYTVYAFPARFWADLKQMRALVLSLTNVDPIPDGSLLFTCRVNIDADAAPGEYQLHASRMLGSTPQGDEIAAESSGGSVVIADRTEESVPLVEASDQMSGGGCAIDATASRDASWLCILSAIAAVFWWRRQRSAAAPSVSPPHSGGE